MKKIARGCGYDNRPSSLYRKAIGPSVYSDKCLSFRIKLNIVMYNKEKILGGFTFCQTSHFLIRTHCVQHTRGCAISIRLKVKCIK